ncbi:MAG TPA: DUF805 domain-containing protein [Allosphingosinicella sp.]|jgi:uncharacterized membrane protein YhaH (DUF805 family)
MTEGTITFEENGFPVELVTARDIERAVAAGRLRPTTLVTQHLPGATPITLRAAEVARLQPVLGVVPEVTEPELDIAEEPAGDVAPLRMPARKPAPAADGNAFWNAPPKQVRTFGAVRANLAAPPETKAPPTEGGYREPTDFFACAWSPLRRYADFNGRSSLREFWGFVLVEIGIVIVAMLLGGSGSATAGGGLLILAILLFFIPSLAVSVRRLHDSGKTGWLVLLNFLPYVGWLIVLILMCLPGDQGKNGYGPDPQR